jgi:hypothetical protein
MHSLTLLLRPLPVVTLCAGATSALAQTSGAISLTQVAPASLHLRIENSTALAGRVQVVRLRSGQTLCAPSDPAHRATRRAGAGPPDCAGPRAHGPLPGQPIPQPVEPSPAGGLKIQKGRGFQLLQPAAGATSKCVL